MHQRISWLFLWAVVAAVALRAQTPAPAGTAPAAMPPGTVLVAKVTGQATMTVNGVPTTLTNGVSVPQSAKVNTLNNSSVTLVFSNGATTQLGADTELVLEEFLQDPFASAIEVSKLTEEPTASTTKLALNRGELVGDVKHLHREKGSTFTVQTPVGAAGIRGTTFKIVFRPNGTGQAFFNLTTGVGEVAFASASGTVTSQTSPTNTGVGVPQGQEITMTVDVTTNAQGVPVVTVQSIQTAVPVNAATTNMQAITAAAQDIAVAVQQTTFTPAVTTAGSAAPPTGSTTTTKTTTTDTTTTTSTSTTTTTPATDTTPATTTTTSKVTGQNAATGQSFNFDATATAPTPPVTPPRVVENPAGGASG